MKILEKYEGNKTYMYPNGAIATPADIARDFPATSAFVHVIETDEGGEMCFAVQNLSALRSIYSIDPAHTEAEAIAAIQEIINTPPEESTESTPEERIAAALEYQNLANMEVVNNDDPDEE